MARYYEDERYPSDNIEVIRDPRDRPVVTPTDHSQIDQVLVNQVTADQNNFPLPISSFIEFSTDAPRNFSGFLGARSGLTVFYNGGTQDGVVLNNSGLSTAENRVFCHTVANITINPGESVILAYNFNKSHWITVGFV